MLSLVTVTDSTRPLHPETQGHEEQEEEEFKHISGGLIAQQRRSWFVSHIDRFWLRSFYFGFLPVTPFLLLLKRYRIFVVRKSRFNLELCVGMTISIAKASAAEAFVVLRNRSGQN